MTEIDWTALVHEMTRDEREVLIEMLHDIHMEHVCEAAAQKRRRDAERHMYVSCPACRAPKRARCVRDGKRSDASHPERAWRTIACPACDAGPDDSCNYIGTPVFTDQVHAARVEAARTCAKGLAA